MPNFDFKEFDSLFGTANTNVAVKPKLPETNTITISPAQVPIETSTPRTVTKEKEAVVVSSKPESNISLLQSAQIKMQQLAVELNQEFVERDELIKIMLLAITTGTNLLMLGPPGTAKSYITYEVCNRIQGANYFQWMLNKTSDPSEILGPFSVKEMENDRFMRITTGKLPEAHIAFMDEVYKSNAPTLNALLTIMNEHIFYNDGKPVNVPLISMFGASNEPPEDESLNAMHDRFIFRINLQYVKDVSSKKRMHANYIDKRAGLTTSTGKTMITLDELYTLQDFAKSVKVNKDIINKFIRLISDLDRQAIHVSDRRQNECFKIMQGSAILRGANSVGLDDFKSLIYVLWEKEDQIPIIESAILKMVNPYDDRFKELKANFEQVKNDIESVSNGLEKSKKAIESKGVIEKIVGKTNKLINEASKSGKDVNDFVVFRDEMVRYNQMLVNNALGVVNGGLKFDDDDTSPAGEIDSDTADIPF